MKVKMCSCMPVQVKKGSSVFGAEHLFTSPTYSHNHITLGCLYLLYLTIQPSEQGEKSKSCIKDDFYLALAGVAQWIGCQLVNQRVTSSILNQGAYLDVGQVLSRGCMRSNPT